jgi:hypothetical protein
VRGDETLRVTITASIAAEVVSFVAAFFDGAPPLSEGLSIKLWRGAGCAGRHSKIAAHV